MENKQLFDELKKNTDLAWKQMTDAEKEKAFEYCESYKEFLTSAKTERLCAAFVAAMAEKKGFKSLTECIKSRKTLVPGDRVYTVKNKKAVTLYVIGKDSMENGLSIVGAHIDAPRLDLKPSPLYEENDMAYFKTHYYGGIKKYQWVTIPLALYGTVVKKDGDVVNIAIGDRTDDPVFCISDLLPHLSQEQSEKKIKEAITGEGLNILVGSIPVGDDEIKENVKFGILKYLFDRYGITESDFLSAELEAVPAGGAKDVGFDRSFIGSYGQDDRVCAYAAVAALMNIDVEKKKKKTLAVILADKEEIGSYSNTGMTSKFFENQVAEIIYLKENKDNNLCLRRCLENSQFLSADVTAAYDPNFPGTHDLKNASFAGKGVSMDKYGGARGKSGCNDANAEFLGQLRAKFDNNGVVWQTGELGRIDLGGGGTIAFILAQYGMEVVDCGTPILNMHAPFELASKADIYMTYKAYCAFLFN